MQFLQNTARWEGILLISGFAIVTLWKLFTTGGFAGMLNANDGTISPGRIQLLALTMFTAVQYLVSTIDNPTRLPDLPDLLVQALAGSQAIYLGAKALALFRNTQQN